MLSRAILRFNGRTSSHSPQPSFPVQGHDAKKRKPDQMAADASSYMDSFEKSVSPEPDPKKIRKEVAESSEKNTTDGLEQSDKLLDDGLKAYFALKQNPKADLGNFSDYPRLIKIFLLQEKAQDVNRYITPLIKKMTQAVKSGKISYSKQKLTSIAGYGPSLLVLVALFKLLKDMGMPVEDEREIKNIAQQQRKQIEKPLSHQERINVSLQMKQLRFDPKTAIDIERTERKLITFMQQGFKIRDLDGLARNGAHPVFFNVLFMCPLNLEQSVSVTEQQELLNLAKSQREKINQFRQFSTEEKNTKLWQTLESAMETEAEKKEAEHTLIALFYADIDVNQVHPEEGRIPLLHAIDRGHIDIVKLLLSHPKIDVNQFDNKRIDNPLFTAVKRGNKELVKLLLKKDGINTNPINADEKSVSDVVGELIEKMLEGKSVEEVDEEKSKLSMKIYECNNLVLTHGAKEENEKPDFSNMSDTEVDTESEEGKISDED